MRVRKRAYPSGKIAWVLDKGGRKTYDTKQEALDALAALKREEELHGNSAATVSPEEMREFLLARQPPGCGRAFDPVRRDYYLSHSKAVTERITVPALVSRFIQSKRDRNASERYVGQLGTVLNGFAEIHAKTLVVDVTEEDVEAWLRKI